MLVRIFGSKTSCSFTGGNIYTMEQSLWKKFWDFLTKANIFLLYDPVIMQLGIYPKEPKTYPHKKLNMDVYSSFI